VQDPNNLESVFGAARRVLNAGCGVGWSEAAFNSNPDARRFAIDFSRAVESAHSNTRDQPNVHVAQASILALPFAPGSMDIVYSIGVIHHTPDARHAFQRLAEVTAPGGLLGVYVYNIKPLLRELADREVRALTVKMPYAECRDVSRQLMILGRVLREIDGTITLEEGLPLLGIEPGDYPLQQFIYDHFLKCFYHPGWSEEVNILTNLDWYHPAHASHHAREEIVEWFTCNGFEDPTILQPPGWKHSGYFASSRKAKQAGST
jgi:SAM-dependent methyltransferase